MIAITQSMKAEKQLKRAIKLRDFFLIVHVSIESGGNSVNKSAFLDSGSTFSFTKLGLQVTLRAQGTEVTLIIAGIHVRKDLKTEGGHLKTMECIKTCTQSTPLYARRNHSEKQTTTKIDLERQSFSHLTVLPNKNFNLMVVGIIHPKNAYELQRPLHWKILTRLETLADPIELGCVVSGHNMVKENKIFVFSLSQKMWKWLRISKNVRT